MKKTLMLAFLAVCLVFSAGLVYAGEDSDTDSSEADAGAAPKPYPGVAAYDVLTDPTAKVESEDVLFIRLHGDEEGLDNPGLRLRVSSDGKIKYPYIGEVEVAGLTVDEVAAKLEDLLKQRVMQEPQVTVILEERMEAIIRNLGTYRILGMVKKPGKYFILSDMNAKIMAVNRMSDVKGGETVVDAIAAAGGFQDFAYPNGVKVRRMVDGKQKSIRVPVGLIYKTGNVSKDVKLEDGDVIVVPQTWY